MFRLNSFSTISSGFIDAAAPHWNPGSPESDNPPFADTQLLISLLGILIFPHERTPNALGELFDGYEAPLERGAPQSGFSMLTCLINARRSDAMWGRPALARDFQRQ